MKVSKGKIVLAVLVVLLAINGVRSTKRQKSLFSDVQKAVTVVADGKVNPENEGKLVLVTGKIAFEGGVKLPELDEPINTFKVKRTVKEFKKREGEDGKTHYDWEERTAAKAYPTEVVDTLYTEERFLTPNVGEFVLDKMGVNLCHVTKSYRDQETICGLTFDGLEYTNPAHRDNDYVGDVSISYEIFDCAKYDYLSVLAKQSGNSFVPYVMGKNEVYKLYTQKIDSLEELKKTLDAETKSSIKSKIFFLLAIVCIALLLISNGKKNAKKEGEAASDNATGATGSNGASGSSESSSSSQASEKAVSEEAEVTAGPNEDPYSEDDLNV